MGLSTIIEASSWNSVCATILAHAEAASPKSYPLPRYFPPPESAPIIINLLPVYNEGVKMIPGSTWQSIVLCSVDTQGLNALRARSLQPPMDDAVEC